MKIANYAISMAATSKLVQTSRKQMHLEYWVGDRSRGEPRRSYGEAADKADISELARKLGLKASIEEPQQPAGGTGNDGGESVGVLSDKDKQKIHIIDDFIYRLTGRHLKIRYLDTEKIKNARDIGNTHQLNIADAQPVPKRAGYGLIYDYAESHSEQQSMSFQANGTVQTADGRTIDFNVKLGMSREFQSVNEMHVRAGDAKVDPLVINLDGAAPQLSQRDFSFDIDSDGEEEQISRLLSGSGFLALDKNGDGMISNGSELFGPTAGNGFAELAQYDSDGNNWIDENDPIYNKLRIWMVDEQGNMQLFALGQNGIGALYLGNAASPFDINDTQNNPLGTVQSTGVFLREDGGAGTMQHIDLTV